MEHHYFVKHATNLILASPILILLIIFLSKTIPKESILATHQESSTYTTFSCKFPAIFNFGDSNSDTGGWSSTYGQAGPPHGETFFHAPAGRYSDGRLIIDFIAESLGLPHLDAYLDSMGSNFSHGANFASAGSTISHQNSTAHIPFPLNVQVYQFHDFHNRSAILRSQAEEVFKNLLPREEYFSQALYTFDTGQNDLAAIFFSYNSTDQVKANLLDILDQFKMYIKIIYNWQGGRYFWIHNTGPLGCLTYVRNVFVLNNNTSQLDQIGCIKPLNEVAQYFNHGLKRIVAQLREELPLAVITYVDIYSIKYQLISQAEELGFENPFVACCGHGRLNNYDIQNRCGAKIMENGKEVLVGSCKDPSKRISWDGAHYTEAANKYVFDQLVNGSYSDPPIPLNMACHKQ